MKNDELLGDYRDRFQKPIPQLLYMSHLSDDDFNAAIEKVLADGKEIDPMTVYGDLPEDALI